MAADQALNQKSLKYPYPPFIDRWVVLWTPGQHAKRGERAEPEIFDVNEVKEIEE
jgi:hypothetical protein